MIIVDSRPNRPRRAGVAYLLTPHFSDLSDFSALSGFSALSVYDVGGLNCACCASSQDLW